MIVTKSLYFNGHPKVVGANSVCVSEFATAIFISDLSNVSFFKFLKTKTSRKCETLLFFFSINLSVYMDPAYLKFITNWHC